MHTRYLPGMLAIIRLIIYFDNRRHSSCNAGQTVPGVIIVCIIASMPRRCSACIVLAGHGPDTDPFFALTFLMSLDICFFLFEIKVPLYISGNLTISFTKNEHTCIDSLVECLTLEWRAAGSNLTGGTVLCPKIRHINHCLVLVPSRHD